MLRRYTPAGHGCRICGGEEYRYIGYVSNDETYETTTLYACQGCGVTFTDPGVWKVAKVLPGDLGFVIAAMKAHLPKE